MKKSLSATVLIAMTILLGSAMPAAGALAAAPTAPAVMAASGSSVAWYALKINCSTGSHVLIHWKATKNRQTLLHAGSSLAYLSDQTYFKALKPATNPGKSYTVSVSNPTGTIYWGHGGGTLYNGSIVDKSSWAECKAGI